MDSDDVTAIGSQDANPTDASKMENSTDESAKADDSADLGSYSNLLLFSG